MLVERLLERVPQMLLEGFDLAELAEALLVDLVEVVAKHPERLTFFRKSCTVDDVEGFLNSAGIQQPSSNVRRDRPEGQLFL